MRLHRLALSAFGPFPGSVEVDLDMLGADGLFLLHGDTGAGKTTLLDAVAFALFGRVPGVRNEARRLRCDRADPHTRTEVTVELTVGAVRLVVTRNPEYARPRSRGPGETRERHRVALRWIGPGPAGLPADGLTRADEVGDAIKDLLGMSAEQFFQVVLLPQGEFARFLRADTADREDLLERLFDTERFGGVETWFADARRDSRAQLGTYSEAVDMRAARVAEAAGLREVPHRADAGWLADLRDRLADLGDSCVGRADIARAARTVAENERHRVDELHARRRRLDEIRSGLESLERAAGDREAARAAITAAERAAPAAAAAGLADTLLRRLGTAQGLTEQTRAALARYVAAAPDAAPAAGNFAVDVAADDVDPVLIREEAAADRDRAGGLAVLLQEADAQAADERAAHRQGLRLAAAERAAAALAAESSALPARITATTENLAAARAAAARVPSAGTRLQELRDVLGAATALPGLQLRLADADRELVGAVDRHQRAVDRRQTLTERRIAGMAAELAEALADTAPCPVCGSPLHPAPAVSGDAALTAAEVLAAGQAEQVAAADRAHAEQLRSETRALHVAASTAARGRDELHAQHMVTAVAATLAADEAAAASVAGLVAELAELTARERDGTARREALSIEIATAANVTAVLTERIAGRLERLGVASAGHPTVLARRDHLLERAALLESWAATLEAAGAAAAAAADARQRAVRHAAEAGFADLEVAIAAAAVDLPAVRERVRAADDLRLTLTAQLADPVLTHLDVDELIDPVAASHTARAAAESADRAVSAADAATARSAQVAMAGRRLAAAWAAREPVAAADAELAALADVVAGRGQNHRAMSLRAYVLAAKLQQVAVAGGARLERMSGGRYTFVHAQGRETRGRTGGLGLDVLDSYSGLVRPTKTLSGGETFLASLALALGLSDVVAAESGGRVLDTLFIDEGFGTLDADTLELVMGTLDELRAGGRIVGLVSHVEELRQRIPSRLRVVRTASGSAVEMSVA